MAKQKKPTPLERDGIKLLLELIPDKYKTGPSPSIKAGIAYLVKMVYP